MTKFLILQKYEMLLFADVSFSPERMVVKAAAKANLKIGHLPAPIKKSTELVVRKRLKT
jgi:hypothetical protein